MHEYGISMNERSNSYNECCRIAQRYVFPNSLTKYNEIEMDILQPYRPKSCVSLGIGYTLE